MIQSDPEFWNKKKVLVTGGAGFLGKSLVPKLISLGANVFVPQRAEFDLREKNDVKSLVEQVKPEFVIHLAVNGGGIGYMRKFPGQVYYDNTLMNTYVAHYSLKLGVKKFVGIGTVCEYPKYTPCPFKEEELWNGYPEETNAPYGLAKRMLLVQSQAYNSQYGFNAIHLLLANLYGPHDNFNVENSHVIPGLIAKMVDAQLNDNSPIEVWGTGNASREFLFVDDASDGILLAAERYNNPSPINIGIGREITIKNLVSLIAKFTNYTGEIVWNSMRPDGQPKRHLDISKAQKEFGFEAKTTLEEGLIKTINWYKNERTRA